MSILHKSAFVGLVSAVFTIAAPASAEEAWHSHSTPRAIGSFEVPCAVVETESTQTYERVSCDTGDLLFVAAVLPMSAMAPEDMSADEAATYAFEAMEAEASNDPELTGFLAVEAGGMDGFYVAAAPEFYVNRMLAYDLGDGRALLLLASSFDVDEGTEAGQALGALADRFLISFKVTPQ